MNKADLIIKMAICQTVIEANPKFTVLDTNYSDQKQFPFYKANLILVDVIPSAYILKFWLMPYLVNTPFNSG